MDSHWIFLAFAVVVQLAIFLRWLHRRIRDDEIQRAFVRDVAVNHLPHVYHALHLIAAHMKIELSESPSVRFPEINGSERRSRRESR